MVARKAPIALRHVAIVGTMDTNWQELGFVARTLREMGGSGYLVDVSLQEHRRTLSHTDAEAFEHYRVLDGATLAAEENVVELAEKAVAHARHWLTTVARRGELDGSIGLGGGRGTTLFCDAVRDVSAGTPRVLVTTVANGDLAPYLRGRNIIVVPSLSDFGRLNHLNSASLWQGCAALAACCDAPKLRPSSQANAVGVSAYGSTRQGAGHVMNFLEQNELSPVPFHVAAGGGGLMTRALVDGHLGGIVDLTLGDVADSVLGGCNAADNDRISLALACGRPVVLATGACGTGVFNPATLGEGYLRGRPHVWHTRNLVVVRATVEESRRIAEEIGTRLAKAKADIELHVPTGGMCAYYMPGMPLHSRDADTAFFDALERHVSPVAKVVFSPFDVNDRRFADTLVSNYLDLRSTNAN